MRVELNEYIRAVHPKDMPSSKPVDENKFVNYHYLLSDKGRLTSGNIQKPMFYHADTDICCPAIYFHSNPLKTDRAVKPWTDVLLPDEGLVYYNGDNQTPGLKPAGKQNSGNEKMEQIWEHYSSHKLTDRQKATPIIIFEQIEFKGNRKGFRAFRGYGLVTKISVRQEYEPKSKRVFSNYLFEVTLLKVPPNGLDWRWIYDRRDLSLPLEQINRYAPEAWKVWVKQGLSAINKVRQHIAHYEVSSQQIQVMELLPAHKKVLNSIVDYYPKSTDKGKFEALASLIAQEYFGEHYTRGWITKHSGDMGIDFIGRIDIKNHLAPSPEGTILGGTKLLVLGQAKCRTNFTSPKAGENAQDIARVAARLQRGYIGIYITTGTFTIPTQTEVAIDGYPIVLINGRQLADLLIQYMNRTGMKVTEILEECDIWYKSNKSNNPPENFLHDLS
jgi:hypothetical protein